MKSNRTLWVTVSLVALAVLAVIALIVANITRGGNDSNSAPASQGEESNSSATDTDSEQFKGAEADMYGRDVKLPVNEFGAALGQAESFDSTQCEVPDNPPATIQRTNDVETLWSPTQGPSTVSDKGVINGYSNSAEGAMLSMWNTVMMVMHGGGPGDASIAELVEHGEEIMDGAEGTSRVDDRYGDWGAPDAFRIISCHDGRVIGEFAVPMPVNSKGESDKPVWSIHRGSATWVDGVWKTDMSTQQNPNEEETYSLEGWTKWQL